MEKTSAPKASLLLPRWKSLPIQSSLVYQAHAEPILPLLRCEPSVQMLPQVLQFWAVSISLENLFRPPPVLRSGQQALDKAGLTVI